MTNDRTAQKRVAIYLRVSTGETTDNQRRELEAVAARHGWRVMEFFEDAGISGAKGPRQAAGPRSAAQGRRAPRRRHGRGLVGRSPGPIA
jgi:DNA invertase Pin-like site-specific DNA recombinase